MLVRQGVERTDAIDLGLAAWLAGVAGALNAAAFHAVGFFSANMTGNVSALSDRLALGQWTGALFYLAIVLAFVGGATASALLVGAGRRRDVAGIYAYGILSEAMLLAALGAADLCLPGRWRVPVTVLGLAFLMGLQNAIVTRISGARVRTTHISGMATDLGIELAASLDLIRGRAAEDDAAQTRSRLRLHGATILAFLLGGVIGVLTDRVIGDWLLILAALALLVPAIAGIRRSRDSRSPG